MTISQKERILNFTSPLGANVLLPEYLSGTDGISELFDYQVELVAEANIAIDPKKIIGSKVTIGIVADDNGKQRYINGIVTSFESCGGDEEFNNYRAHIVPNIWLLTLNMNTRVFQDKTVTDVIKAILSPYNISPSIQTSAAYTPMEYCTQYRETDFDFISRLMEQHGILYYFQHTDSDHTFTLQDTSSKLSGCAIQSAFRYAPEGNESEGFYDFVVTGFASKTSMVTGKYSAWDYSFIRYKRLPDPLASANTSGPLGSNSNEQYDYAESAAAYLKEPGSDSTIADLSNFFQNNRRDAGDTDSVIVEGVSNAISMQAGYSFTLSEYPQAALNTKYLLIHVEHGVRQTPPYRARGTATAPPYGNTFTAIPFATRFRPLRKTPKPVVHGMHTGQVVVPSGEESYMDKYGRVCVQFFWDRLRQANKPDNTLLRVAQSWAGKGWGTYFWPRVNDEVLIDFIEGDPDQPIVVGSVYNGVNMPKYDPASQYTRAGILTRSSKDGGASNANELRFEDKKGSEQIFLNAERDMDHRTENDNRRYVGGKDSLIIKGGQYEEVGTDRHANIKGNTVDKVGGNSDINIASDLNEKVGSNYSIQVGQNHGEKVGQNYALDAGTEVYIKAGMTLVIESGMELCLKGAGGFITIGPAGIAISGTMVMINSGGAAVSGSPASPQSPGDPTAPDEADDGNKGGKKN